MAFIVLLLEIFFSNGTMSQTSLLTQLVEPVARKQVEDRCQEGIDIAEHIQAIDEEGAHIDDPG